MFPAFLGLAVRYISLYEEQGLKEKNTSPAYGDKGLPKAQLGQLKLQSFRHKICDLLRRDGLGPPYFHAPTLLFSLYLSLSANSNYWRSGNQESQASVMSLQKLSKEAPLVKSVKVRRPFWRLLQEGSVRKDQDIIQTKNGRKDVFDFSSCINKLVHNRNLSTSRIVAPEPHKQEIVAQLDHLFSENETCPRHIVWDSDMKRMDCVQISKSSMLLLMKKSAADNDWI